MTLRDRDAASDNTDRPDQMPAAAEGGGHPPGWCAAITSAPGIAYIQPLMTNMGDDRSMRQLLTGSAQRPASSGRRARHAGAWVVALMLALTLAFAVTGCGSSNSGNGGTPHVYFAKTKFLLHAGLAFGAFHRYIYKPYKAGGFTPVSSRKLAIVKAGAAGLFVYHEIKIALVDAQSSSTLSKLVSPLTALEAKMSSLGTDLKSGKVNGSAISQANSSVSSLGSKSASSGASIKDLATPSLG
jgi:hypothetical protein